MQLRLFGLGTPLLALLVLAAPPASAAHWCTDLRIATGPAVASAGEPVNFTIAVSNGGNATVTTSIRVRFDWETGTLPWETVTLAPGAMTNSSQAKIVGQELGDRLVTILVQGGSHGSPDEPLTGCPAVVRVLRVQRGLESPRAIVQADVNSGAVPLRVTFSLEVAGGAAPFSYAWSFGDNTFSNASAPVHVYETPGTYMAQVVIRDARGQLAVDRAMISPIPPSKVSTDDFEWLSASSWLAVRDPPLLLLVAFCLLASAWAALRPASRVVRIDSSGDPGP
ncbi:MAG: PKD domain-containing protein, partial [Euryarchaeota archaeon]|nr:PKD domain-containing protein [Euryarchaeota archaeon]